MKSLVPVLLITVIVGLPASVGAQSSDTGSTPAAKTASAKTAITKKDARKAQSWISQGSEKKALGWVNEHLGSKGWCEAASRVEGLERAELDQFRADLGVLARRSKRADEAMACMLFSLGRRGSSHRAAAIYEAYLTLPQLDVKERKRWINRMNGPKGEYGNDWGNADNCIYHARGPIHVRLACALWKANRSKLSASELREHIQPLIFAAARLAPKQVYLDKLTAGQRKRLKAESLAELSVHKVTTFGSYPEATRAMRAEFDNRRGAPLEPCSRYRDSEGRYKDVEHVSDEGCYDFAVEAKDAKKLAKGNVRFVRAEGGPVLKEHVGSAYHGCHGLDRSYLDYFVGDRHAVLDLGLEHGGDNCYVAASRGTTSLAVVDAARGIVRVTVESRDDLVTSHAEPRLPMLEQRDFLCQVGAEGAPVVCIEAKRANRYHSKALYALAPAITVEKGKITLQKRSGDYVLPEYDALEGLTLLEAAGTLPKVEDRITKRLLGASESR